MVVGRGPSALLVRLDTEAVVDFRRSRGSAWFDSFKTRGTWAAVAIQEMTSHRYAQQLGHLQVFASGCEERYSCIGNTPTWYRIRAQGGLPEKMTLEPGTYWVYVLADPGVKVEARFDLEGIPGRSRLKASEPVGARFSSDGEISFVGAAHSEGKITGRLEGRGLVIGGHWWSDDAELFSAHYSVSCFQKGSGENDPLNTCGVPPKPEPGLVTGAATTFLWKRGGTWTYNYRRAMAADDPDSRMGAFGLFFTFLSP